MVKVRSLLLRGVKRVRQKLERVMYLIKKFFVPFVFIMILSFMLSACGGEDANQEVAVVVALTQTASAIQIEPTTVLPTEAAAPKAIISGSLHLMAPPTPSMTIYAVNVVSGEWFSMTTEETDGEAPYSIEVVPGTYEVFTQGLGYALDGEWEIAKVSVEDGQTLTGINVIPPSPSDCGPMFGTPAAPDGSFAAVGGPDQECVDFLLSGSAKAIELDSATSDLMRIQFDPGSTMAQIEGHIAEAMGGHHYVLGAAKDQYMTVNIISDEDLTVVIWGADGTALVNDDIHATSWSGALPASQDYYIDVRSYSAVNAYYTLEVYISAGGDAGTSSSDNEVGGAITGAFNYPESYEPPMHVVAYNLTTGYWYWVGTAENSYVYTMIDLPSGIYTVVAYTQNGYVGGYASAGDGELMPFQVSAGQMAEINMTMWLEPDNDLYPRSDDPISW
jgi:hypothetical protein